MKQVAEVLALLLAFGLIAWAVYQLPAQRRDVARSRSPIRAALVAGAIVFVGSRWLRK